MELDASWLVAYMPGTMDWRHEMALVPPGNISMEVVSLVLSALPMAGMDGDRTCIASAGLRAYSMTPGGERLQTGWLVPLYADHLTDHMIIMAVTRGDNVSMLDAGQGSPAAEAFQLAHSIAMSCDVDTRIGFVRSHVTDAFWVRWGHDTFVTLSPTVIMPGSAYDRLHDDRDLTSC